MNILITFTQILNMYKNGGKCSEKAGDAIVQFVYKCRENPNGPSHCRSSKGKEAEEMVRAAEEGDVY